MGFLVLVLVLAVLVPTYAWWRERTRAQAAARLHADEIRQLRAAHAAELGLQEKRLQAELDAMIEGIVILDAQSRVAVANRAAATMFAFSGPVTGRALLEVVRHHEVAALVSRLAKEPSVLGHELRLEGPPSRFLEINAVRLNDHNGVGAGSVLVFHDLTRVRELEGVRQEFVANVSHELRTPLSLIKGATETLMDGAKADAVALDRLLAIIDRHADRLTLLIDDLLLLAKLDSGRMTLNLQPAALRLAVQEVADDLVPRAQVREVKIINEVPAGLVARADSDRLRQVLSNLIDNAIKYGRAGGAVTVTGKALDESRIEICVRDDGPGIPPEAKSRVFERFFRVEKARSREQGGTGLGLAIVKHVVQAHGGQVRLESEPAQGAAFFFTLPR